MTLQVLVAAMHQTDHSLLEKMNIQSDAMIGKKVILIDADMRKPTQRRLWKVEKSAGLCDFFGKNLESRTDKSARAAFVDCLHRYCPAKPL